MQRPTRKSITFGRDKGLSLRVEQSGKGKASVFLHEYVGAPCCSSIRDERGFQVMSAGQHGQHLVQQEHTFTDLAQIWVSAWKASENERSEMGQDGMPNSTAAVREYCRHVAISRSIQFSYSTRKVQGSPGVEPGSLSPQLDWGGS
jgi:hypothetical protein